MMGADAPIPPIKMLAAADSKNMMFFSISWF